MKLNRNSKHVGDEEFTAEYAEYAEGDRRRRFSLGQRRTPAEGISPRTRLGVWLQNFRVFGVFRGTFQSVTLIGAAVCVLGFAGVGNAADANAPVAPVLLSRGPHSKTWQTVQAVQIGDQTILRTNSYQELATGSSYLKNGAWADSQEVVSIVNGQGVADQGLHQAVFSASIADSPAVTYTDPDGQVFKTRVMGLCYFSYASGQSALVCETQPSIGWVQGNTVIYTNAFTDNVRADVRYTYRKGSFEQDIILRAQLPSPAVFGLDPKTTRLQVWNEMLDAPSPLVKDTTFIYQEMDPAVRQALVEPDFKDDFLSFGQMQIGRGKAFVIDSDAIRQAGIDVAQEVPVGKEWTASPDGRRWLLESVEFAVIEPLLATLPMAAAAKPEDPNKGLAARAKKGVLPRAQFLASLPKVEKNKPSGRKIQTAQAAIHHPRCGPSHRFPCAIQRRDPGLCQHSYDK